MKVYNKLVRDKIPEIMRENDAMPVIRILNNKEYVEELKKKLQEEVSEYLESGEIEELADMQEVMLAILDAENVEVADFEKIRTDKVLKKGAFSKKIFLIKEE